MRAFMDNRLQTIRAGGGGGRGDAGGGARAARARAARVGTGASALPDEDPPPAPLGAPRAPALSPARCSDTEFRPQKLFEFDADAHDDASGSDSHPQASPTYKSGCWVLKHVGDTVDSELPGEIAIEHMVDHSV